jgi:SAM-dependent methyltransferase
MNSNKTRGASYGWEPLPVVDFLREMDIVGRGESRRFLDVGSGIGEKLALAGLLGFAPQGIEIDPELAYHSRRFFPYPVEVVDAYDFRSYHRYDVIYCYRPMIEVSDQVELNSVIAERMNPGALFVSVGGPWPKELNRVDGQVYRR